MNETRWKGTWWIPGAPDDAKPGILHYRDDGQLNLELVGGFSLVMPVPAAGGGWAAEEREPVFPMIHGMCGAERFTLLNVVALHTSGGLFGDVTDQSLNALRGLRGIHLASAAERVFDSAEVQLEYLLGWTAQTTMKASVTLEGARWTGRQTAQSTAAVDQEAAYGGLTFTLRVPHTQFGFDVDPHASQRTVSSREWAELEVASPEPLSHDGFEQVIKAMADLMTLCAHAPSGAVKRTLWFTGTAEHPAPAGRPGEVEVLGRQIHRPLGADGADRVEYLFTLADADFAVVVPAWLALYEQASRPCGVLFGLKYISQGYVSMRLLGAASSAEALHQSLHDATPYCDDEFRDLLKKVLSVFPGTDKKSKSDRRFIRERLSNHMTFRDRVLALAAVPDQEAVASLIPDTGTWADLLKWGRNSAAHAGKASAGAEELVTIAGLEHALTEVTYALLSIVLLAELGFPAQVQRRAASAQSFMIAAANYAKATSR
jgi:ApeA N-terminal domain 1